jgi:hypothetical protein
MCWRCRIDSEESRKTSGDWKYFAGHLVTSPFFFVLPTRNFTSEMCRYHPTLWCKPSHQTSPTWTLGRYHTIADPNYISQYKADMSILHEHTRSGLLVRFMWLVPLVKTIKLTQHWISSLHVFVKAKIFPKLLNSTPRSYVRFNWIQRLWMLRFENLNCGQMCMLCAGSVATAGLWRNSLLSSHLRLSNVWSAYSNT